LDNQLYCPAEFPSVNSNSIAMGYGTDDLGSIPNRGKDKQECMKERRINKKGQRKENREWDEERQQAKES
jgi:hypothetical protein